MCVHARVCVQGRSAANRRTVMGATRHLAFHAKTTKRHLEDKQTTEQDPWPTATCSDWNPATLAAAS